MNFKTADANKVMAYKGKNGKLYNFRWEAADLDFTPVKVPARRAPDGTLFTNDQIAQEYLERRAKILRAKAENAKLKREINWLKNNNMTQELKEYGHYWMPILKKFERNEKILQKAR